MDSKGDFQWTFLTEDLKTAEKGSGQLPDLCKALEKTPSAVVDLKYNLLTEKGVSHAEVILKWNQRENDAEVKNEKGSPEGVLSPSAVESLADKKRISVGLVKKAEVAVSCTHRLPSLLLSKFENEAKRKFAAARIARWMKKKTSISQSGTAFHALKARLRRRKQISRGKIHSRRKTWSHNTWHPADLKQKKDSKPSEPKFSNSPSIQELKEGKHSSTTRRIESEDSVKPQVSRSETLLGPISTQKEPSQSEWDPRFHGRRRRHRRSSSAAFDIDLGACLETMQKVASLTTEGSKNIDWCVMGALNEDEKHKRQEKRRLTGSKGKVAPEERMSSDSGSGRLTRIRSKSSSSDIYFGVLATGKGDVERLATAIPLDRPTISLLRYCFNKIEGMELSLLDEKRAINLKGLVQFKNVLVKCAPSRGAAKQIMDNINVLKCRLFLNKVAKLYPAAVMLKINDPRYDLNDDVVEHALRLTVHHDGCLLRFTRYDMDESKSTGHTLSKWVDTSTATLGDLLSWCERSFGINPKTHLLDSLHILGIPKFRDRCGAGRIESEALKGERKTPLSNFKSLVHGSRLIAYIRKLPTSPISPPPDLWRDSPPVTAAPLPPLPPPVIDAKLVNAMDSKALSLALKRSKSLNDDSKVLLRKLKKAYKEYGKGKCGLEKLESQIADAKELKSNSRRLRQWVSRAEGLVENVKNALEAKRKKANQNSKKYDLTPEERTALHHLSGDTLMSSEYDVNDTHYYEIPLHEVAIIDHKPHQPWVAAGKTAKVYRAVWKGVDIAWKVLQYATLKRGPAQAFAQEVEVLRVLTHENVVRLVGVCTHGLESRNGLCIATEWCNNGGLDGLVFSSTKMSYMDVLRLSLDIARGMEFVHLKNLVHRDLKLPNILLTLLDQAKIGDFGTALFKQRFKADAVGTQGYQAPEVFLPPEDTKIECTSKVDIFSYGICLWHLATRSRDNPLLARGMTLLKMKTLILEGKFLPWPPEMKKVPKMEAYRELMDECVTYHPDDRPTFTDIVKRLEGIMSDKESMNMLGLIDVPCPSKRE
ncbi:hypothetical protein AAMO2058_001520900 [Amorphochlora amoebiformis]